MVDAPTEVAGDDGVDTASTLAEFGEFDSEPAGAGVFRSASDAGSTGGVLASEGSAVSPEAGDSPDSGWVSTSPVSSGDSVVLLCAPPLLLMVTSDPTWLLEEVVPDVFTVPVEVEVSVPVVDVAADSADASPVDVSVVSLVAELAKFVEDESEEVPVVSATAIPWPVATAVTSHAATAMPPYPPTFAAVRVALRDDEANSGLTG